MHFSISVLFDVMLRLGETAAHWFDGTTIGTLLVVAFVLRMVIDRLPQRYSTVVPTVCGSVFLLAYFVHRFQCDGGQFEVLILSVIRSFLASYIVWSVIRLITFALGACIHWMFLLWLRIRQIWQRLLLSIRSTSRRAQQWYERRHPPPPLPKPAPPPPRAVRLKLQAEAAQADYNAEVAALAGLSLDDDERETLMVLAKQRLIQRLSSGGQI
jgi:hypothetical protein